MPHVIVKLYPGRSDAQKRELSEAIARAVMDSVGSAERSISVSVEDVSPDDWQARVYEPEIAGRPDILFKKPGYGRLAEKS
ncbi:tautomerase family protein [Alsobacter sp. SYSU M60028]|uniref:Tautomerase family protein n=1 Tax=Alsobacter ponti TaxID=2962936 RepID=A0ABT1L9C6_9HYPH|nr:tautomerase family protein [Alsobacter ponti]MCP8937551.1 tautomerase family protein [Alsobacter ponti]